MLEQLYSFLYDSLCRFLSWLDGNTHSSKQLEHTSKKEPKITFKLVVDPDDAYNLQRACFLPEECDNINTIRMYHREAPELFYGAYVNGEDGKAEKLIGFLCGIVTTGSYVTKEITEKHEPHGDNVCVNIICVDKDYRYQGISDGLIFKYRKLLDNMNARHKEATGSKTNRYKNVLMVTHASLIPYYEHYGCKFVGLSKLVMGPEPWYDMRLLL
ncbi:hypothetical protein BDF19DRAFT_417265 [Syncephalis fuscata]|nr:hypothetical protein BDF19DRAFT_417265 [Syncephalis fuscata]